MKMDLKILYTDNLVIKGSSLVDKKKKIVLAQKKDSLSNQNNLAEPTVKAYEGLRLADR